MIQNSMAMRSESLLFGVEEHVRCQYHLFLTVNQTLCLRMHNSLHVR